MRGKLSSPISSQKLNLYLGEHFYTFFVNYEFEEKFTLVTHKINPSFSYVIISESYKILWAS